MSELNPDSQNTPGADPRRASTAIRRASSPAPTSIWTGSPLVSFIAATLLA